ncbi:MAG: adenylate/guanylate cyclase domain-containing protein [Candidatus Rifleibacteriota bacterium]
MKIIEAKTRINGLILIAIWILLVLLPFVAIRKGIKIFFEIFYKQNLQRADNILYSELANFSSDLDERVFLEEKLAEFLRKNRFQTFNKITSENLQNFSRLTAEQLRKDLEKHLGFPVLAVFSHSIDTQNVQIDINRQLPHELRTVSSLMARRFFSIMNGQADCVTFNPQGYKPAFSDAASLKDETVRKNYTDNFIQLAFGTVFPIKIQRDNLYEILAGKTGKTGNIFLFYGAADCFEKNQKMNLGGFFAAIRLQDIPEKQIRNFACSRNIQAGVRRRIGYIKKSLPFPESFKNLEIEKFYNFPDRYARMAVFPQIAMVRTIQRGTILPVDFSDFAGRTLVMEVSLSQEKLKHFGESNKIVIDMILRLFLLIGSALMVYLWLFPFNLKASLISKMALISILICLIPVISLYLMNTAQYVLRQTVNLESVKKFMGSRSALIQRKINEEIDKYRYKSSALAEIIKRQDSYSDNHLEKLFYEWAEKNCANAMIFQKFDQKLIRLIIPALQEDVDFLKVWDLKKVFFTSLIEFLFSSPLISDDPGERSAFLTEGTNNSESIHESLVSDGELLSISRVSPDSRLSGVFLRKASGEAQVPYAFLSVDYSIEKILHEAFKNRFKNFSFSDNYSKYRVSSALVMKKNGKFEVIENCKAQEFDKSEIEKILAGLGKVEKNQFLIRNRAGIRELVLVSFAPNLPCVSVVKAVSGENKSYDLVDVSIWIYPFIIIVLALLSANIFFVRPALEFSDGLLKISEGHLDYRLQLATGDEFEDLSISLNAMTRSLLEKQEMEKFVSPELIRELNENTVAEMLPGGEKVHASILFSTFKVEKVHRSGFSAEETVEQIDLFLTVCDSICVNNHGVIDKIIGSTIMMVFRRDHEGESHAVRACNAAVQIHEAMRQNRVFSCRCCSGISSGTVVSGKIGSKTGKLDYTVIGDTVNMAARLKALAEETKGSSILVSESCANLLQHRFSMVERDPVKIKGKQGSHRTWSIN